jgi:hypothetical protein
MTWILIVVVLGSAPVETGLRFGSVHLCAAWADYLHEQSTREVAGSALWKESTSERERQRITKHYGADNVLVCIPRDTGEGLLIGPKDPRLK